MRLGLDTLPLPKVDFLQHRKLILQAILLVFVVFLGIYFFQSQGTELEDILSELKEIRWGWIVAGGLGAIIYLSVQGWVYQSSFTVVGSRVNYLSALWLYLRRYAVSIFLPGGSFVTLTLFTKDIEEQGVTKTRIYLATYIYALSALLEVGLFTFPILVYLLILNPGNWLVSVGFGALLLTIGLVIGVYRSLTTKGWLFRLVQRLFPELAVVLDDVGRQRISRKALIQTVFKAMLIDVIGTVNLYFAFQALGVEVDFVTVLTGYVVVVLVLMSSPFLKGLGLVEVALTYFFTMHNMPSALAFSLTLVFRVFQFWIPLTFSLLSFVVQRNSFVLRLLPALVSFILGLVNLLSLVFPTIPGRLAITQSIVDLPQGNFPDYFILVTGLLLIITAVYLIRGSRNAWWLAVGLSVATVAGLIVQGFYVEEMLLAGGNLFALIYTRRHYNVASGLTLNWARIRLYLAGLLAALIYGSAGFYFLDEAHFAKTFDLFTAFRHTVSHLLLIDYFDIVTETPLAVYFIYSLYLLGTALIVVPLYFLIRPAEYKAQPPQSALRKAERLIHEFGHSRLDPFKTYGRRQFFFLEDEAVVSYRVHHNYAVALDAPVGRSVEAGARAIDAFEAYCRKYQIRMYWYRVPEGKLGWFEERGWKKLLIGSQALVDVGDYGSGHSVLDRIEEKLQPLFGAGYHCETSLPPHTSELEGTLKSISDQWRKVVGREERNFASSEFNWEYLQRQTLLLVKDPKGQIIGFSNILPDYSPHEGSADLVRFVHPEHELMHTFLLHQVILYHQKMGKQRVNLGMVPYHGLERPDNLSEVMIGAAYEIVKRWEQLQSLEDTFAQFEPEWEQQFLVFRNSFDLIMLPSVLPGTMRKNT